MFIHDLFNTEGNMLKKLPKIDSLIVTLSIDYKVLSIKIHLTFNGRFCKCLTKELIKNIRCDQDINITPQVSNKWFFC